MRVHRNLHAARQGGPQWVETVRGLVVAYHAAIELAGVTTRIQPAGVRRCHERQVRSVCAYLDGELCHSVPPLIARGWEPVVFDPRHDTQFTTPNDEPWNAAPYVILAADGRAWAYKPRWEERS